MTKINARQKSELRALVEAFDHSGFDTRIVGNICYHHRSYVGWDYKAFAQMAPFIVSRFVSSIEIRMWVSLSEVRKSCN